MALICSDNISQNELIPVFPLQLRAQFVKKKVKWNAIEGD